MKKIIAKSLSKLKPVIGLLLIIAIYYFKLEESVIESTDYYPDGKQKLSDCTDTGEPSVERSLGQYYKDSNKYILNTYGNPKLLLYDAKICSKNTVNHTLLYVYSSPSGRENRDFIRQTYGNSTYVMPYNLTTVFVLGMTLGQNEIPKAIIEEQEQHGDLVVGDFIESYRNLSWKGLTSLNFIRQYCKGAKFIVKADDDTMIDMWAMMDMLHTNFNNTRKFYVGYVRTGGHPKRCLRRSRWCVTKHVYKRHKYPPYMLGMGFAFSADLVDEMYNASLRHPVHPVDDVYMTGILSEGIKNRHMEDLGHAFLEDIKSRSVTRLLHGDPIKVAHLPGLMGLKRGWAVVKNRDHSRFVYHAKRLANISATMSGMPHPL